MSDAASLPAGLTVNWQASYEEVATQLMELGRILPVPDDLTLPERVRRLVRAVMKIRTDLVDAQKASSARATEIAHLRQELDTARAAERAADKAEREATRARRHFVEGLVGQPYAHEVLDLLERADQLGKT